MQAAAPLLKRAESKLAALPSGQSRSLALALFVGVPAPGTGAWTGALIAALLGMPIQAAMGSILVGVVLAGGIMTLLTLAGKVYHICVYIYLTPTSRWRARKGRSRTAAAAIGGRGGAALVVT